MENGYHAKLREFLRRAYHSYQLFLQFPDGFEELKRDPFWENSRQKPKVLNSSKLDPLFLNASDTVERSCAGVKVPIPTKPPGCNGIMPPGITNDAAHRNGMMPPGSRASLADGLLSPAMVLGQAFLDCFAWVRRRLSPASSMR